MQCVFSDHNGIKLVMKTIELSGNENITHLGDTDRAVVHGTSTAVNADLRTVKK